MKRSALLVGLLAVTLCVSTPVRAEDENPWEEVFLEDGSLSPDLIDMGVTVEHPEWMSIDLPFGQVLDLPANYHRYQTPQGNIVVLPSAATLFFMAMHPEESGLSATAGFIGDGRGSLTAFLGLAAGSFINWDQAQAGHPEYADPEHFWQAALDGNESVWTYFSGWSFITQLLQMSWEDASLRSMYLLYLDGAVDCTLLPGGCAGVVAPPPPTRECPVPTVSIPQPQLVIRRTAPSFPLVVGQDEDARRGADVEALVTIPPVVLTWYEPIYVQVEVCREAGYGEILDCSTGSGSNWLDGVWDTVTVFKECRVHVERLPDKVVSLRASAALDLASQEWITGRLSQTHYEAYIRRVSYLMIPGMGGWSGGCDAGAICSARGTALRIPFTDPGTYLLDLAVATAGTSFQGAAVTAPRLLSAEGFLQVWVTLPALVQ